MSYILDALRRAESERGRGEVPGLHAQTVQVGLGEGAETGKLPGVPLGALAAAALALVAALVWWWVGSAEGEPPAQVAGAAPPAGATAVSAGPEAQGQPGGPALLVAPPAPPSPPAPPVPPATRVTSIAPVAPRAASPTAPVPAPQPAPLAAAATPAAPAVSPAPRAAAPAGSPAQAAAAANAASPSTSASPGGAAAARPTLLADLPQAQRAELPQMLIGGAIYSDQPTSRFVVINGLVVREGETAAPGVVLERIGPKSALIRWRELRIELPI